MTRLFIATAAVVLLAAGSPALAQSSHSASAPSSAGPSAETQEGPLTLDQAIARGLAASHRLGELQARVAGTEAAVQASQAADRPQVAALAGYTRTNHVTPFGIRAGIGQPPLIVYPDIPDNFRSRLDLQWPIYTFGRTDALERAARAESQASGRDLAAARNDLRLEITRGYWAVVTAGDSVNVLTESLRRMDATLEDVRNRLKVGLIPPNDVLSVEAQRSRQQVLLIQARNLREQALADLRRLIGAAPNTPIALQAQLDAARRRRRRPSRSSWRRRGRHAPNARPSRRGRRAPASAARRPRPASGRCSRWAEAWISPAPTRGSSRAAPTGRRPGMRASTSTGPSGTGAACRRT